MRSRPMPLVFSTAMKLVCYGTLSETAIMTAAIRLGFKLLLLTGQRPRELLYAQWEHFDFDRLLWGIPVAKSRRLHVVPLSAFAFELLRELQILTGTCRYVLGPPRGMGNETPPTEWAFQVAVHRNREHFKIAPFTTYDLRRTVAHGMFSLDVPIGHIAEILGRGYGDRSMHMLVRHDFLEEKRAALEKWANCLRHDLLEQLPAASSVNHT